MSTTAFGLGSKYFALYEVAGVGIQWRTISQSPVEGDDFNLGLAMTMLIMDAAVYGVLTWYIEAVHPGESRPVQARAPCTQQGSASFAPPPPQACTDSPGRGTSPCRGPTGPAAGGRRPGTGPGVEAAAPG